MLECVQRDNKVLRELKDYDLKNTKVCPKCGSCDVVGVPGGVEGTYVGNNVHIGFFRSPVGVAQHMCCHCGFIKEWIDDPKGREKIKKKYGGR
ncbi:MAG: hypothetical protein ABFC54_04945 [Thermoguttaceae bacterium]